MHKEMGFTLIEIILVFGMLGALFVFASVNLFLGPQKETLTTTVDGLISDLRQQQIRAVSGDTGGAAAVDEYGVYLAGSQYILFRGSQYAAGAGSNFAVDLPEGVIVASVFPSSQVVFQKGSGEVSGHAPDADTITVTHTQNNQQQIIQINKLGSVIAIN